jgi:hypothetical protein
MARIWSGKRNRAIEAHERAETARWLQDVIAEVEATDAVAEPPLDGVVIARHAGALEVA